MSIYCSPYFCLCLKFSTKLSFLKRIKSYHVDPLATPGSPNLPLRKGTEKNIEKERAQELKVDSLGRDISDAAWKE